ncbi:hypothetical protein L1987_36787 [Smallanthus sonchifolius]|uniref:Uncharacterized protein n=1 Tax=Smallanthus sonchifolius TaxID=185202 RepID=A0ACB9HED7_9ASTR|nr:hypothetical protein L1987_36787 [Smallanthus sonchifolius]
MFKSPRRNGRTKGFKIKHVIQITMLLGVSIWLLYHIHHSDDKKSSVTTKISQKSNNDNDSSKDIYKLGRKVLRPKVKETKVDDEQNNENEDAEGVVEDHESDEHEEVGENEHADGKEDSEEIKEHENEKEDDDDKGHEQTGKIQMEQSKEIKGKMDGNVKGTTIKEVLMSIPSEDVDDQSVRGEIENDKMMTNGENESVEDDTSEQPSVDHNERDLKKQSTQQIDSTPDSYSYETNTANYMQSTGTNKNMKGESEQKDDAPMLEEKNALTDLETLLESETQGRVTLENEAT